MNTPKGMKCSARQLITGAKLHIYNNADQIILQLRHQVPTEEQILEPSFKVAVSLTTAEAIAVASDLLNAALPQLAALRATISPHETETAFRREGNDQFKEGE